MSGVIVHEWLEPIGGAENVAGRLTSLYPDARVSTLWNDAPARFGHDSVDESWLARTPLRGKKVLSMPLMPIVWRHLGDRDAEWILCCSHLFAHHARFSGPARTAKKLVYAYTPARYIWAPDVDGRGRGPFARVASKPLRMLDRHRSAEADSIAAVSSFVRDRIRDTWGRDARVIHPPVDLAGFMGPEPVLDDDEQRTLDALPDGFLLGASRFVRYKRLDSVIEVGVAADLPVVLAGDGPERESLRALADKHPGRVTFVHRPSHALLAALYRKALAFVFLAVEDFGLMPVEAMASGTPVICSPVGGAAESVVHGTTGYHLSSLDPDEVREAVRVVSGVGGAAARSRALEFAPESFDRGIREWIGE